MTAIDRFKERIEKIQRRREEAKTRRGNKELIWETDIVLSESLALLAEIKALQKDNAANLALIKRQCDELADYRAINHDSAWHNLADVEQIKALQGKRHNVDSLFNENKVRETENKALVTERDELLGLVTSFVKGHERGATTPLIWLLRVAKAAIAKGKCKTCGGSGIKVVQVNDYVRGFLKIVDKEVPCPDCGGEGR